ncbi:Histone-lysine N-methyltransferase set-1 [Nibea albiflora]|uniref:Histone-lysine N-methyltransferase set-1 n=1 Tax=Nibea albiflora TaxID=240163 RepID=A0ACB7EFM3_NIBAL|nr:Histone-lysine N-methyltransferase set-1 [Nibea albiflora]
MADVSKRKLRIKPHHDAEKHIRLKTDKAGLRSEFVNSYKGRGVFASAFRNGDFVLEHRGKLFPPDSPPVFETYTETEATYLFEFKWKGRSWCLDASLEDQSLGRLVNDEHRNPNCKMQVLQVDNMPHFCLFAVRDIVPGEEVTYSYGDSDWPWHKQRFNTLLIFSSAKLLELITAINMDPSAHSSVKVRCQLNGKQFVVSQGLTVCFLTDSMCRGISDHIQNVHASVHPGTFLSRSLAQHTYHFNSLTGEALVVTHIGTNDISRGLPADIFLEQMTALIQRLQRGDGNTYFAVCAILPRPVDDPDTKALVKQCNSSMEKAFVNMPNVTFLQTNKLFLSGGAVLTQLFGRDGLHLSAEGKDKLFSFFKKFLWHFCRHA